MPIKNEHYLDVDLKLENYISLPRVTRNDDVFFIVRILDDGRPVSLNNVQTALLASLRPDKKTILTVGNKLENEITFKIESASLYEPGRVNAAVQLFYTDGRTSTLPFHYEVVPDNSIDYAPSESETSLIQMVLGDAPFVIEAAQSATIGAEDAAAQTLEALDNFDTEKSVAIQELDDVKEENRVNWKQEVATVALRDSTYPNPQIGDTVRITGEARIDRFNGTEWITTDRYNPAVVDELTGKLAETGDVIGDVDIFGDSSRSLSLAIDDNGINIKNYGAIGDGITDDTQSINKAIVAALQKKGSTLWFPYTEKGYLTTQTITIPVGVSTKMDGFLLGNGPENAPCLVIGEEGKLNNKLKIEVAVRKKVQSNWLSENTIGVKIINADTCSIYIQEADRFTIGVQCIGANGGFAYNTLFLNRLLNNKYSLECTDNNNLGTGWCNENIFIGGRLGNYSNVNPTLSRYGVRIKSQNGNYLNNNNYFLKTSFELGVPTSGEVIPVLIENGIQNEFKRFRNEGNSAIFARIKNNSTDNIFESGYGHANIEDLSNFPATLSAESRNLVQRDVDSLVFLSGSLIEKAIPYNSSGAMNIGGIFCASAANTNISKSQTSITVKDRYVSIPTNRGIGIRLDTHEAKRFLVKKDVSLEKPGRVWIRCYNSNGELLADPTIKYVKGASNNNTLYATSFGGSYTEGIDSINPFYFVLSEEVKKIDVLFQNCDLRNFAIYTDKNKKSTAYNPLTSETESLAAEKPTTGVWFKGKKVYNDGVLASGTPVGWINTVENGCDFKPFGVII